MTRKTSNKRARGFTDDEGNEWDSQFEFHVYCGLRDTGYTVRRTTPSDSVTYHSTVKQGRCLECSGTDIVQVRTYTPDLHVVEPPERKGAVGRGYYIECKGYFPAQKRSLLRAVLEFEKGLSLRVLFPREAKLTPFRTNVDYVLDMIKCPAGTWNYGKLEWRFPT